MVGTISHPLASQGRYEDDHVAHVAAGEMIVPGQILASYPQLARYIAAIIQNAGGNPEEFIVGSNQEKINPITGKPEFSWISDKWHQVTHAVGKAGKAVGRAAPAIVGYALGGPVGAAVGGAVGSAGRDIARGKSPDIGDMLTGATYGYGGSSLANALASGIYAYGASGPGIEAGIDAFGRSLATSGNAVSKALGVINTANSLFNKQALAKQKIGDPEVSSSFSPKRPEAMSRPESLNELGAFSPEQERSYLATRGKNTGLGSEEEQYYNNLVQRSLIGEGNKVNVENPNFLLPIESSYYSSRGKNTSDVMEFLRSLQA